MGVGNGARPLMIGWSRSQSAAASGRTMASFASRRSGSGASSHSTWRSSVSVSCRIGTVLGARSRLLDDGDPVAGGNRAALGHPELLDRAGARRGDLVLHLHGLDHADQRAGRAAAASAVLLLAARSVAHCRGSAVGRRGVADHLDVEAATGDLDRVVALDLLGLILVLGR